MRIQAIKRVFALFFLLFFAEKSKKCTKMKGGKEVMPRAKLTFEERVWLEEALNKKVNHMEICLSLIHI